MELHERNFKIFGLDESRQMARIARKNILNTNYDPMLARGLAQSLPFESGSMDNIFTTFPSEYIFDKHTLAEILRVLKPSGSMIVVPMAWLGGKTYLELAASWLFKITGETVELTEELQNRISSIFKQAGFQGEFVRKEVGNDLVLLIISRKKV